MSDLIRREDALKIALEYTWGGAEVLRKRLRALPAVQSVHVNETPKREHVPGDVLTPATKEGA